MTFWEVRWCARVSRLGSDKLRSEPIWRFALLSLPAPLSLTLLLFLQSFLRCTFTIFNLSKTGHRLHKSDAVLFFFAKVFVSKIVFYMIFFKRQLECRFLGEVSLSTPLKRGRSVLSSLSESGEILFSLDLGRYLFLHIRLSVQDVNLTFLMVNREV